MPTNKVVINTENGAQTLIDLTSDTVTPETLLEGVTAHDKSGVKITGTMPANTKTYELTLAKSSGWVLLTTLDDEALAHINDESFSVSLVNVSPYEYAYYSGSLYLAGNIFAGVYSGNNIYGIANREKSEAEIVAGFIYYPANYTAKDVSSSSLGAFRVSGAKYYIKPGNGFIKAGNYRLTLTW